MHGLAVALSIIVLLSISAQSDDAELRESLVKISALGGTNNGVKWIPANIGMTNNHIVTVCDLGSNIWVLSKEDAFFSNDEAWRMYLFQRTQSNIVQRCRMSNGSAVSSDKLFYVDLSRILTEAAKYYRENGRAVFKGEGIRLTQLELRGTTSEWVTVVGRLGDQHTFSIQIMMNEAGATVYRKCSIERMSK